MAETLYATSHLSGDCPNPDNALSAPDGVWAGPTTNNSPWDSRWAIGDPVDPLTTAATQTITVRCRKTNHSTNPSIQIALWENGVEIALKAVETVTSTTGQDHVRTFASADVTNPANVEIRVIGAVGGGSPSNRASLQIDSITWTAETTPPATDRMGQVSWAELELPNAPRQGQVSWAELELPNAPRDGQVSWAEMELPNAPRQGQVSWAELELPNAPRSGQVSWAELEIPDLVGNDRMGQVSWAEMELPNAPRGAQVSWAEMEIGNAPRGGQVSWAELELPNAPRMARVSWAEMEVPNAMRGAQVSWAELEVPGTPAAGQVSWAEMEIPDVGGEPPDLDLFRQTVAGKGNVLHSGKVV